MFHPLLASSFEGIEIILFVPALVIMAVLGLICALVRWRDLAVFFGVGCSLLGIVSLLFASGMHGVATRADAITGVIAIAVALVLIFVKRNPKQ